MVGVVARGVEAIAVVVGGNLVVVGSAVVGVVACGVVVAGGSMVFENPVPASQPACLSVSCVQMSYLGKWTIKSVYFATDLWPINSLSCLCERRCTLVHNGRHTFQWRGSPSQCNVPGPREC